MADRSLLHQNDTPCARCYGTGMRSGPPWVCGACAGTGQIGSMLSDRYGEVYDGRDGCIEANDDDPWCNP